MSHVNIDQLRERIALLSLCSQAGIDGREIRIYNTRGYAWAKIACCPRFEQRTAALTAENRSKSNPTYKIIIRSMPSEEQIQTIRAIRWKERLFDLLSPFTPHPCVPNYLQAFCTETKRENKENLERKRGNNCNTRDNFSPLLDNFLKKSEKRGCQRYQNVDSMKYKKDKSTKINSKQKVNSKIADDLGEPFVKNQETQRDMRTQRPEDREGGDHAEN